MNQQNFRAEKKLGQHFLHDQEIVKKICLQAPEEVKLTIEVGPGPGALTRLLAQNLSKLILIEKDERFKEQLLSLAPQAELILGDALEIDYQALLESIGTEKSAWLVSNLPYNISVPLMIIFFQLPAIKKMTLMMQKEVGERILYLAKNDKGMNSLRSLAQNYFRVEKLCSVLPGAFSPPPKVDSVVLNFFRQDLPSVPLKEFKDFEHFLRKLFFSPRKQLKTVLKAHYLLENIESACLQIGIEGTLRAEKLSIEQVISLYRHLGIVRGN